MHGMMSSSTRGVESSILSVDRLNLPPSMYSPYTKAPVAGGDSMSLLSRAVTSQPMRSVSTAILKSLEKVCLTAVMKPCGKKNTGSGKAQGSPFSSHTRMKATRNSRSATHEPSVFREAKEVRSQMEGSWLLRKAVYMASRSELITIMPLMAFLMLDRELRRVFSRRLNLTISWARQMASEVSRPLGWRMKVVAPASSSSSKLGHFSKKTSANSTTTSSEVLPPPPEEERGCRERMAAMRPSDSLVLKVTLAFSCMPNTSGSSLSGRLSK
mmetsp:Transcript_8238/g.18043  ORF Transcript_8238/g.18043 Transcript_8238/m.18043 type:complete len:270 (-) Transcript_8238:2436-3245(-)